MVVPSLTATSASWQPGPGWFVAVYVAGRDRCQPEPAGQGLQPAVAGPVVAPVGPLKLDPEALRPEPGGEVPGQAFGPGKVAVTPGRGERTTGGAAAEADQPGGPAGQGFDRHRRLCCAPLPAAPGMGVCFGQQPTEVGVAGLVLDQQGEVEESPADRDGQLGSGDRLDPGALAGDGELHRTPDAVVIGQGQSRIAEVGGAGGQLERGGGSVEEGER